MHIKGNKYYLFFALILLFFISSVILIDGYGRGMRKAGKGFLIDNPEIEVSVVDYPEDSYHIWKKIGLKGRVVLSFSRRLNFIEPDEIYGDLNQPFPIQVFNISKAIEKRIRSENFLLVSMETGIARRIIHVVPQSVYREKLGEATEIEGVRITDDKIEVPFYGSPREIITMPLRYHDKEPVLLYINASFFKDYDPVKLYEDLLRADIKTDHIVLCHSFDDSEVTEAERQRLSVFLSLIKGKHEQ